MLTEGMEELFPSSNGFTESIRDLTAPNGYVAWPVRAWRFRPVALVSGNAKPRRSSPANLTRP
jgi:hypothetical protein